MKVIQRKEQATKREAVAGGGGEMERIHARIHANDFVEALDPQVVISIM